MSSNESPDFDLSAFEAEFADASRASERRAEALAEVSRLWNRVRDPNITLPTSRRFIIAAGANIAVPAPHERILLIPRPRAEAMIGVKQMRVSVPYLASNEGGERRLDNRFAFLEFMRDSGTNSRALLSEGEFSAYSTHEDIQIIENDGDVLYTVRRGVATEASIGQLTLIDVEVETGTPIETEATSLASVTALLSTYDPDLQDNQPLFRN